jgi:hypothetical protein
MGYVVKSVVLTDAQARDYDTVLSHYTVQGVVVG